MRKKSAGVVIHCYYYQSDHHFGRANDDCFVGGYSWHSPLTLKQHNVAKIVGVLVHFEREHAQTEETYRDRAVKREVQQQCSCRRAVQKLSARGYEQESG